MLLRYAANMCWYFQWNVYQFKFKRFISIPFEFSTLNQMHIAVNIANRFNYMTCKYSCKFWNVECIHMLIKTQRESTLDGNIMFLVLILGQKVFYTRTYAQRLGVYMKTLHFSEHGWNLAENPFENQHYITTAFEIIKNTDEIQFILLVCRWFINVSYLIIRYRSECDEANEINEFYAYYKLNETRIEKYVHVLKPARIWSASRVTEMQTLINAIALPI